MKLKTIAICCVIFMGLFAVPVQAAHVAAEDCGGNVAFVDEKIPHYTVDGQLMATEMQDYIYRTCTDMGIEFYYPYFLCQIYQESKFNSHAVSRNGLDYGYCQLRIYYHDEFKAMVGHPEWDLINDPFANVYVGCYLMKNNLEASGYDISGALAKYFNSGNDYCNYTYVQDVSQWFTTLERIEE